MILKKIIPEHIGPFSNPTEIALEPDITVFTGANDTGKSSALASIALFCGQERISEEFVNIDRIGNSATGWSKDTGIRITADLEVTKNSLDRSFYGSGVEVGDLFRVQLNLNNTDTGYKTVSVKRGEKTISGPSLVIHNTPRIVKLTSEATIRSEIDLNHLTLGEQRLLKLAFGAQFAPASIQGLTPHSRGMHIDRAREKLTAKLKEFFPQNLPFEFRFTDIGGEGKRLGVALVDHVQGYTPLSVRGSGIRQMLSLMGLLLQEIDPQAPTIVLLDEPENSLHADAQHQLRRMLEKISLSPTTQVVYATHSPSMVNPSQPQRVRVFSRHHERDRAASRVDKLTYSENFQQVRVSLGLTPSDSLLYGLVTILVEGDTEARSLGTLLRKLDHERIAGFAGIASMLEACHFVCSWGDSISYYARLAKNQNGRPIVFLDGDKRTLADRLRREDDMLPVFELPRGSEFEQVVPKSRYIAALAQELANYGANATELTVGHFDEWWQRKGLPEQMMFSKRVERWVADLLGMTYSKHVVMEIAIAATPADEIEVGGLSGLAQLIREQFA